MTELNLSVLYGNGDYIGVVNSFENGQSDDTDDKIIYGAALFQLGDLDKGAQILESIYNISSENEGYLSLLGATYRRLGRFKEATEVFEYGMKVCSVGPPFMNNYANLLTDLGRYEEAVEILEAILKKAANYHDAIVNLKRAKDLQAASSSDIASNEFPSLFTGDRLDPLLEAFSDVEKLYSMQSFVGVKDAGVLSQVKEAVDAVSGLIKPYLHESDGEGDLRKLAVINKKVNPRLTINLCNSLVRKGVQPLTLYSIVAEAYINLSRLEYAERYYLMAYANGQYSLDILANLAQLANIRGAADEAENFLKQAYKFFPDNKELDQIEAQIRSASKRQTNDFIHSGYFPS